MALPPDASHPPITARAAHPARLDTSEALAAHLEGLGTRDPRLAAAIARAGEVSLRTSPGGFTGMARVICGQQLSVASARAIWGRLEAMGATTAPAYLALEETDLRGAGLSAGKHRTLTGLARAIEAGAIDFDLVDTMEPDAAIETLTALKGIGPWTAEIYLLFCAGHPDIFPAGDLALQKAVAHALDLPGRPASAELIALARDWSPHRGAAALMFWRYFSAMKNSDAWDAL
ncbi:DNA-3-methyladenine glycosylase family protein [Pelagibacterium montanilacus]|uniref:DNA-3-methyladenine glycosylase family protein n=1 Tax=Pelagibacterium montanilacus TaxID=2185280 RepID=UPI000F8D2762|nr:DNA-3-methyladenine glycosylase [Pelagibacterium montanilacus]